MTFELKTTFSLRITSSPSSSCNEISTPFIPPVGCRYSIRLSILKPGAHPETPSSPKRNRYVCSTPLSMMVDASPFSSLNLLIPLNLRPKDPLCPLQLHRRRPQRSSELLRFCETARKRTTHVARRWWPGSAEVCCCDASSGSGRFLEQFCLTKRT